MERYFQIKMSYILCLHQWNVTQSSSNLYKSSQPKKRTLEETKKILLQNSQTLENFLSQIQNSPALLSLEQDKCINNSEYLHFQHADNVAIIPARHTHTYLQHFTQLLCWKILGKDFTFRCENTYIHEKCVKSEFLVFSCEVQ